MGFGDHGLASRSPLMFFRDHDATAPLDLRFLKYGGMPENKKDDGRYELKKPGDWAGAVFWEPEPNGGRGRAGDLGQWWYGALAVDKKDGLRVLLNSNNPDELLKAKTDITRSDVQRVTPDISEYRNTFGHVLPLGTVGTLMQSGSQDNHDQWFLPSLELVAHHNGQVPRDLGVPPECSTRTHDLTPDGALDWDRAGGIHSHLWNAQLPHGGPLGTQGDWIPAWNLAKSRGDQTGWGAWVSVGPTRGGAVVTGPGGAQRSLGAFASHLASGPLHPGDASDDKHKHGTSADGTTWNSGHIDTDGYFFANRFYDGPLDFEKALDPQCAEGATPYRVHLRFDPDMPHRWIGGPQRGVWRWHVKIPISVPWIPWKPTETPPWIPWKPTETPPPVITPGIKDVPRGGIPNPGGGNNPGGNGGGGSVGDGIRVVPGGEHIRQGISGAAGTEPTEEEGNAEIRDFWGDPSQPNGVQWTNYHSQPFRPDDARAPKIGQTLPLTEANISPSENIYEMAMPSLYFFAGRDVSTQPYDGRLGGYVDQKRLALRTGGPAPLVSHNASFGAVSGDGTWSYTTRPKNWHIDPTGFYARGTASGGEYHFPAEIIPDADMPSTTSARSDLYYPGVWHDGTALGTAGKLGFGWGLSTGAPKNGFYETATGASGSINAERRFVDASGVARVGVTSHYGTFRVTDGSNGTPSLSFEQDTDTGIYRGGANQLNFTTGGTLRARINTAALAPAGSGTTCGALSDPWAELYATTATISTLTVSAISSVPTWIKYTKTYTQLAAAATTNDIELLSLAAGGIIHAVKIKHSVSFTGGAIAAYTVSVGIAGTLNKYANAFDIFQATGNTVQQLSTTVGTENHAAATSIRLAATSTGANLDQASAGSVDVWVLQSKAV